VPVLYCYFPLDYTIFACLKCLQMRSKTIKRVMHNEFTVPFGSPPLPISSSDGNGTSFLNFLSEPHSYSNFILKKLNTLLGAGYSNGGTGGEV